MVPVCGSPANGMSQSAVASPWHGTGTEAESPAPAQPGPGLPGPRSPRPLLRAQRQDGAVGSCGAPGPAAPCPLPSTRGASLGASSSPGSSLVQLESAPVWGCPSLPVPAPPPAVARGAQPGRVPPHLRRVPCALLSSPTASCHRPCQLRATVRVLPVPPETPWDRDRAGGVTQLSGAHQALIPSEDELLAAEREKLMPLIPPGPSGRLEIPQSYRFPLIRLSGERRRTPSTRV